MPSFDADLAPRLATLATDLAGTSDDDFALMADALRRELAPVGVLETLLVAQLILAAGRLRRSAIRESAVEPGDKNWLRYQTMAERSFWKSLSELDKRRKTRDEAGPPTARSSPPTAEGVGHDPVPPTPAVTVAEPPAPPLPPSSPPLPPADAWRDRLRFEPAESPVLRSNGVRVVDLLQGLRTGLTVPALFTMYPGVTEADLDASRSWELARSRGTVTR
jgi:hypothetical protein